MGNKTKKDVNVKKSAIGEDKISIIFKIIMQIKRNVKKV